MTQEERHKRFEEYLKATPAERRKFDMSFLNDYSEDAEHFREPTKKMQPSENIGQLGLHPYNGDEGIGYTIRLNGYRIIIIKENE